VDPESQQGIATATIVLLTVIMIALIAVLPRWPYSKAWGYGPASVVSGLLVIMVFLMMTGVW
jgi:hypothetical protein